MTVTEIENWLEWKCDKIISRNIYVFGCVEIFNRSDYNDTFALFNTVTGAKCNTSDFTVIQNFIVSENEKADKKSLYHKLFK